MIAATTTANALMGHFDAAATNAASGASVNQSITAGTAVKGVGAAENGVKLTVIVNGTATTVSTDISSATASTVSPNSPEVRTMPTCSRPE